MLWTIKWFPSTATVLLFQPSWISSRHYTSLDQWCHLVGRVASNVIMWYLDIMKCMRVSGLVLWFQCIESLLPSSRYLPLVNMVGLVDIKGGREGQLGCTDDQFQSEALVDRNLTVEGDCSLNDCHWLKLLFNGRVWTDDGCLGRLSMHLNEDAEDEALADVITSAMMIDEGDDFNDNRLWEERVGVYMDWRIKRQWMLRA